MPPEERKVLAGLPQEKACKRASARGCAREAILSFTNAHVYQIGIQRRAPAVRFGATGDADQLNGAQP
jgi:hypothetical protein